MVMGGAIVLGIQLNMAHNYTLMHEKTNLIIEFSVLQVTEVTSSIKCNNGVRRL